MISYRVVVNPVTTLNSGRRGHTSVFLGKDRLLVIGGERDAEGRDGVNTNIELVDLKRQLVSKEIEMNKRYVFHESFIDTESSIYLMGGSNGSTTRKELGVFNLKSGEYKVVNKNGLDGKPIDAFTMTHFSRNKTQHQHHNLSTSVFSYYLSQSNKKTKKKKKKKKKKVSKKKKRIPPFLISSKKKNRNKNRRKRKPEEEEEEEDTSPSPTDSYLLFGGWDGISLRYNHLFEYDPPTNEFRQIYPESPTIPSGRTGHSAVMFNNQELIIFGGNDGRKRLNDTYSFDLRTRIWKKWEYSQNNNNIIIPVGRSGHSAQVFSGHKMIICGGFTGKILSDDDRYHDDRIHILNLVTKHWEPVILTSPKDNLIVRNINFYLLSQQEEEESNFLPLSFTNSTLVKSKTSEEVDQDFYFCMAGGYDILGEKCMTQVFKIHVYDEKNTRTFGLQMMNQRKYSSERKKNICIIKTFC